MVIEQIEAETDCATICAAAKSDPMPDSAELAIVLPVYNEGPAINGFVSQLQRQLEGSVVSYRIILVDDGSSDQSWTEIAVLSRQHECIDGIRFWRNFGKEAAIHAGIAHAMAGSGARLVAVMDSDGQHPPEALLEMLRIHGETGCQVVHGVKRDRGNESITYRLLARTFYRVLRFVSDVDLQNSSDFKLLGREAAQQYLSLPEQQLFFRGVMAWMGGRIAEVPFDVRPRLAGSSSFGLSRLIRLAWLAIRSYSAAPLRIVTLGAGLFLIGAILLGIQTLYNKISGHAVDGFTTVILLQLFIGSVSMFGIGMVGEYLASTFAEVKKRPRYLVAELARANTDD